MNNVNKNKLNEFAGKYYGEIKTNHLLLNAIRTKGLEKFNSFSFPDRYTEEWKYTDVKQLADTDFIPAAPGIISDDVVSNLIGKNENEYRLVFINGVFAEELSELNGLANDIIISGFNKVVDEHPEYILSHTADMASIDNIFNALNTAFINDGAVCIIPDNKILDKTLSIIYVSGSDDKVVINNPRNLFVVGKNSEARIVQKFIGNNNRYFTNSVTEVLLNENSKLELYKLVEENSEVIHIEKVQAEQEKNSKFYSFNFDFNGKIIRNDINSILHGEGAEAFFNGLYIADNSQHIDNHTQVDHAVPNCFSNEVYKGIMSDESTGVFNGKIIVRPNAQQTNAYQSNKNILLNSKAKIYTKPQLEIFADDVKCSHGATIGKLDEQAMFYLQSRGIPKDVANMMLIKGFISEIIAQISDEKLANYINSRLLEKLKIRDKDE